MNDKICHSGKESNDLLEEILRFGEEIVRGNAKIKAEAEANAKAEAEKNDVELSGDEVITRLIESIIGKVEDEEGSKEGSKEEDSVISVELRNPKTGTVGVLYSAVVAVDYDVIRSLFAFYSSLMDISNITVVVIDPETGVERYTADVSPFGSINNIYLEPEDDESDGAEEYTITCPPTLEEIVKLINDTPDEDDFIECEGCGEEDPVMTVNTPDGAHLRIYTHEALEIYLDHTAGDKL